LIEDPTNRKLVAQATIEKLPLISADAVFDHYGLARLWK